MHARAYTPTQPQIQSTGDRICRKKLYYLIICLIPSSPPSCVCVCPRLACTWSFQGRFICVCVCVCAHMCWYERWHGSQSNKIMFQNRVKKYFQRPLKWTTIQVWKKNCQQFILNNSNNNSLTIHAKVWFQNWLSRKWDGSSHSDSGYTWCLVVLEDISNHSTVRADGTSRHWECDQSCWQDSLETENPDVKQLLSI